MGHDMTTLLEASNKAIDFLESLCTDADDDCGSPVCPECNYYRSIKEVIKELAEAQDGWQKLTDKEILADDVLRYHFGLNGGAGPVSKKGKEIVAAVEAKLKEKNNG